MTSRIRRLSKMKILRWAFNCLIAVDQLVNALFGGSPDECVSSRLYDHYPNSILRKFVDIIFGKDHCKRSASNDNQTGVFK